MSVVALVCFVGVDTMDMSSQKTSVLQELSDRNLWVPGTPLRLHLGCGEQHMDGYVNIDYPQENHNVQTPKADFEADILALDFPPESVDEIRLHHVFEHFPRVKAYALLIRWREWLRPGGRILIETPDLVGSAKMLLSDAPWQHKSALVRHLAGDQADKWAYHVDHWFPERFQRTLDELGFIDCHTESTVWGRAPYLCNVIATASKGEFRSREEQLAAAERLLRWSLVAPEEEPMLVVWKKDLHAFLDELPTPDMTLSVDVPKTCAIVFSKDRAFQLDGFLRSFRMHVSDWDHVDVKVIYTTSTTEHEESYQEMVQGFQDWDRADLHRESDFKQDLTSLLVGYDYVLFFVDDTVFTNPTSIAAGIRTLQQDAGAIGFSYRLGRNSIRCYPYDREQALPKFQGSQEGMIAWDWTRADGDFAYPLEVSSSLYRLDDLWKLLRDGSYSNPNSLEACLSDAASAFAAAHPRLCSCALAPAFSAPMNMVQKTCSNRVGNVSSAKLLESWLAGKRMDVESLRGLVPNAAHMEIDLLKAPGCELLPLVSVIIPCYNQAQFLEECIESVVAQTYSNLEILIVDDGSPDNTVEMAQKLIARHASADIRLVQKENGGVASARNFAIQQSRGELVLPLDSDDAILPEMLARLVSALDAHPEADLAACDIANFGMDNRVDVIGTLGRHVLKDNCLPCCTLFRRKVWEVAGGYNPNMRWGYEDWDFWVSCYEHGFRSVRVPQAMFRYRVKTLSRTTDALRNDEELRARIVVNHVTVYDESRKAQACDVLVERANAALLSKDQSLAMERLLLARKVTPAVGDARARIEMLIDLLSRKTVEDPTPESSTAELDAALEQADAFHRNGKSEKALELLVRCEELAPNSLPILNATAWLLSSMERLSDAHLRYMKAAQQWPDEVSVHANLAGIRLRMGQTERAESALQRVLELDPNSSEALVACLRIEEERGNESVATQLRERLARIESSTLPQVSFCIITNGVRPDKLAAEIASIRNLAIPAFEILVGGELPADFNDPDVFFVPCQNAARNGRLGEMRNRLVDRAQAPIVVVVDDDMIFAADFWVGLERMDGNFDVVCPRLLNPDGTRYWDWAVYRGDGLDTHYLLDYDQEEPDIYVTGGLCVARRDILMRVRWNEGIGFYKGEDVEFSSRLHAAGVKICCNPAMTVRHDDPRHSQFWKEPLLLNRAVEFAYRHYSSGHQEAARAYLLNAHKALPGSGFDPELARQLAEAVGDRDVLGQLDEHSQTVKPIIGYDLRTLSDPQSHGRGIGHYALHHLEAVARSVRDFRLVVVHPGEQPDPAWASRLDGYGIEWMPASRYVPGSFDLLHCPDPMGIQADYQSPLWFFDEPRLSVTFHDLIPLRFYREKIGVNWPTYLNRLDLWMHSPAHFLCNSNHTASELMQEFSMPASRVVPVGAGLNREGASGRVADSVALRKRLGIQADYCLYIGAMDPHKNFEATVQSVLEANKRHPMQLVVTGRPNAMGQKWMELLQQAGIRDRIVFAGYLERDELEALYAGACALVFLSRIEGFGFPALEAMANGCPVICSNAASLPEVVGDAALLHDPDDLTGACASILRLCREPKLREEMIRKGRERAKLFTWEDVANKTISVWRQILSQPPRETGRHSRVPVGVEWASPVFDPSGYASESRAFLIGLESAGIAPAVKATGRHSEVFRQNLPRDERAVLQEQLDRQWEGRWPVVMNMPAAGFSRTSGARHIGRTTFETDGLPADWVVKCNQMDEIWVPSRFNLETFRAAGVTSPLLCVPEGVDTDRFRPGLVPLDIPGAPVGTTFLSVFEWTHRKGWDVLLKAWSDAFTSRDDVRLVIRAYPANAIEGDPGAWVEEQINQFLSSIGSSREACAPIVVLGRQIPESDMPRLYASADVYLAPSRGEGWGRPHMEAMSSGLLTIATRWSGNLDFMNDENSWLLDIEGLESIDSREEFEFYRGQKWAQPSSEHLSGLLRRASASPDGRKAVGAKARIDMVERWDWKRIAPMAAQRLREIEAGIAPCDSSLQGNQPELQVNPGTGPTLVWSGPIFNHSGHARQSREAVLGLDAAGVQVQIDPQVSESSFLKSLEATPELMARWDKLLAPIAKPEVLVCCDLPSDAKGEVDVYATARAKHTPTRAAVAWCTFETDRLPSGWLPRLQAMDEVWVPSTFNREGFVRAGLAKECIQVMPEGIDPVPYRDAKPYRLPETAGFTFLSVFQWSHRKGWEILLGAWAKAFSPKDDVQLVLRCSPFATGARSIPEQAEAFLKSQGLSWEAMAPVILLEDPLTDAQMPGLYAACDVFVLPTRGEGWGLPFLEAMATARPCIATRFGGQTDFLNDDNAWLLEPGELVPPSVSALSENPFLSKDHRWADPSEQELAECMRHAFSHREEGQKLGRQGQQDVATLWSHETCAGRIAQRLAILSRKKGAYMSVRWEGSQFVHHSLAHINREVCLELAHRGHDLSLLPWEPDEFRPAAGERLEPLLQLVQAPLEKIAEVHVRHQWPPRLEAPEDGRWVAIQPWEFGPVPKDWVDAWKDDLDELWVPSQFVKDGYVESGMPAERIAVIPNGVDTDRFCPQAKPMAFPSNKTFRFLFVGGTIYRKGIDILLTAYARAFRDTDDVCLVVKDMGGKTFYKGQTADDLFERFGSHAGNPELIVLDEPLSDAELPGLYTACNCLVHPYRGEGFGMPIAEAMAAGLPVVVTDGGPAKEFCSADNAWFVPAVRKDLPGRAIGQMECAGQPWLFEPDVQELARLMREVWENRSLSKSKGKAGRQAILSGYTWKHMTDRVEARLAEIVTRPQRRKVSLRPARNILDPSLRNSQAVGDDQELNLLLMQVEPAIARGDVAEARDLVEEAVEKFPRHPLSWLTRAILQRASGKFAAALADVERSIACKETPEALSEGIENYLKLKKQGDAQRILLRLEREHGAWCILARSGGLGREWIGDTVKRHGAPIAKRKKAKK
jgi:glycosyltransferase involved in cell wall biosynthesis/GT2 family glycosyltransferase/Tfp pilus assembly protein PilF/predicted SAM-dependent methyltransferase